MALDENATPLHNLYTRYLYGGESPEAAKKLWGLIPHTMGEAYKALVEARNSYKPDEASVEELAKTIKRKMRSLGVLTGPVSEALDRLCNGVIEAGQQPMCLGGSSLILNKIVYIHAISHLGRDGFVPIFFVADYDGVQPELLNMRTPSPSSRGLLVTYPAPPEYEGSPIHNLPNPDEVWLWKTIEKIEGNYRGLLREAEQGAQQRALQNLSHISTILRNGYYSTENVSDWSTKTLASLVNVEGGLGIPFLVASDPEARRLFQAGYELLLSEPKRSLFVEASNGAVDIIEGLGFRSQIGRRGDDYVPFFLECSTPSCHGNRIELKYRRVEGSSAASVQGRCGRCSEVHEYSFNAAKPDLSEIAGSITPRVDSRQIIVDSVLPVLAHVGGPGETSYYAEVIPGARALGIPFPVYLRYTRTFYNTPWNEAMAKKLALRGLPTLDREELFGALSAWVQAKREGNEEKLLEAHIHISKTIDTTYSELLERRQDLMAEIDAIKAKLGKVVERDKFLQEMRAKQVLLGEVEGYLSSAFGRFSPEKYGQEVSWLWIDLAAASGVRDLTGLFARQYSAGTPNSSVFYVNL